MTLKSSGKWENARGRVLWKAEKEISKLLGIEEIDNSASSSHSEKRMFFMVSAWPSCVIHLKLKFN